jgi:hypothetical protein
MLHETATLTQSARFPEALVDHVTDQLTGLLDLRMCRFESGSLLGHPPRLERDGTVVASHVRWDVEVVGMPEAEFELRVANQGRYFGRFMLTARPGARPSLQARLVAVTLADQVGRAYAGNETARTGSGYPRAQANLASDDQSSLCPAWLTAALRSR